jgi:hypothetical protein
MRRRLAAGIPIGHNGGPVARRRASGKEPTPMPTRFTALFAGLLTSTGALAAPTPLDARDWPYEIVRTAGTLYLKGRPKQVTASTLDNLVRVDYRFYPNGVVKHYQVGVAGYETTRFKGDRLVEMRQTSSLDNGSSSTYYQPFRQDDRGRVTTLVAQSYADDGVRLRVDGEGMAVVVTYGEGYQIKETYFRRGGKVDHVLRERFEFAPEGWLARKCPLAPGKRECGADAGPGYNFGWTSYGPAGPLRHENGKILTVYRYENGDLVEESRTGAEPAADHYTTRYRDYRHDACGNWVERTVEFRSQEQAPPPWRETRSISYYEDCPAK